MGVNHYKVARWRFTWRNRTKWRNGRRVLVLGPTKDQRTDAVRGRCRYYSVSKVLEDHIRLKFYIDVEISIEDLERKVPSCVNQKHKGNTVWMTCDFLKETGALAVDFEENLSDAEVRFKLEEYNAFKLHEAKDVYWAVGKYMSEGPMMGVFPIHDDDMEKYSQTELDEIYFVSMWKPKKATHSVALPGYGFVSTYPFWHFENSYGAGWRGPARGFGQLYAPHLQELYGVKLKAREPSV